MSHPEVGIDVYSDAFHVYRVGDAKITVECSALHPQELNRQTGVWYIMLYHDRSIRLTVRGYDDSHRPSMALGGALVIPPNGEPRFITECTDLEIR